MQIRGVKYGREAGDSVKLVHMEYGIEIELKENQIPVLVIESPETFSKVIQELYLSGQGGAGKFILSEGDKLLPLGKTVEFVINPFEINLNEKRILQKLYQEMESQVQEQLVLETAEIHGKLISYLEEITQRIAYPVTFDLEENVLGLMKTYNVRLEEEASTLLEELVEYFKLLHQLCRINVMVCVNLKTYLSETELNQLYEAVFYEKINLLLLENMQRKKLKEEKICIVDKDGCIIDCE